jgi:hypothetical protein
MQTLLQDVAFLVCVPFLTRRLRFSCVKIKKSDNSEDEWMSIFRTVFGRFQKQCETSESHRDENLRTRYYKASFNKAFETAENVLRKDPSVKMISSAKEHGEMAAEITRGRKYFAIITIVSVRGMESAIDVNISTEQFSPTGAFPALKKEITGFYSRLDKELTYLGSGRNAE